MLCLVKPETDEHELLSVAAVDGGCQLQHRSFKQKELVGKACVNKHTFQNQSFQNLMHFDVFDVKGCSSTGTRCRWIFHYLKLQTVYHQWFFALLLLSLNFTSSTTCDPCISNFDDEMMMCFVDLAHGSPAEQQFLKALANSRCFKYRNVHLLLKRRAGTSVVKLKVCETGWKKNLNVFLSEWSS